MKTNRTLIIIVVSFLCLCLAVIGIGYLYFASQPPSTVFNNSGYYTRLTKIYYLGGFPSTAFEVEGADAFTFEIIDEYEGYAKDKNQVYLDGKVILKADPATFELLEDPYARDKNNVYSGERSFSNDPENFEFLPSNLARDSHHIYWASEILSDDPSNFTIIDDSDYIYWKDSKNIFIGPNPIEKANMDTFEVIDDVYARDEFQVFYFDEIISQADLSSFEIIESPYAKDDFSVFFMEHILPDADPQTFYVLNIKFQCSADGQTAYYRGGPIPNFDPNTIPSDAIVSNCDENGIYYH